MKINSERNRCNSGEFHVGDAYIWATIHYLDSATNYREYLVESQPTDYDESPLVMLDDTPILGRARAGLLSRISLHLFVRV